MTQQSEIATAMIAELLKSRTGQKLASERTWRIGTSLAGLFREKGINSLDELVMMLAQPGQDALAQQVVEALLNNETYFFRDRALFDHLMHRILPSLAAKRQATRRISIWSAGCSTGQEALSIAMHISDQKHRWQDWRIDILATDISSSAIDTARMGRYTQFEIQRGLTVGQMLAHFDETPQGWQVRDQMLGMIRYERHNLLDAPPSPGSFDLILCRNVLLYFDAETRARACRGLASALAPDGKLMLGSGETITAGASSLVPCQTDAGFFRLDASAAGDHSPVRAAHAS